ncbi:hypothetical protein [uncultured Nocardioides sp.]|uniref:hypothetical protein n=1 Tax=uncultured Nocardioides sp. TaxID=198441 RepID=UPI002636D1C0|nr:hypothetical protein [uncultured Nocardioides sp.]
MRSRLLSRSLLLAALLVLLSPLGTPAGPAAASCASPYLELERHQVIGRSFEVTGHAFVDGCQDSMGCEVGGCTSRCTYADPAPEPIQDAELVLRQRGRAWTLASADADTTGQIDFSTTLPPGVEPGRAVLTTGHGARYVVRLVP